MVHSVFKNLFVVVRSFRFCGQLNRAQHVAGKRILAYVNVSFNIAMRPAFLKGVNQLHADRYVCKGAPILLKRQLLERRRPQNLRASARRVCQSWLGVPVVIGSTKYLDETVH